MTHEHDDLLIALAGQPNCGKSTIFTRLTGIRQSAANIAGVTVEKKTGHYKDGPRKIEVVDLPGTYSFSSYTQEERVTRDFVLLERPEVMVIVIDASNLRRHLMLAVQLLEMGTPTIVCLNMIDVAERRGMKIDIDRLSQLLGIPVVATVGSKGEGINNLRETIRNVIARTDHQPNTKNLKYKEPAESFISRIAELAAEREHLIEDFSPRWIAVKLLESDTEARRIVQHHTHDDSWRQLLDQSDEAIETYQCETGESMIKAITTGRYRMVETIFEQSVEVPEHSISQWSDRVDSVLCRPIFGLVAAIVCAIVAFTLTFKLADGWNWIPLGGEWTTPVGLFAWIFEGPLVDLLNRFFTTPEGPLYSMLHDGILGGVGGVVEFVPVIFFMFLMLAILEESGYIARVAMVSDRLLRRFGLAGHSIVPLIVGGGMAGGCAVPGVLAARSMKDRRQRLVTMLVVPLMNCGAKMPVYALLIAAFFSAYQGIVMASLVFISWGLALLTALLLRNTLVRGGSIPLVIELPPYHLPHLSGVFQSAWGRTWLFLKKAGTIILAANIILWAMLYYPRPETPAIDATAGFQNTTSSAGSSDTDAEIASGLHSEQAIAAHVSYAGRIGTALEPVSSLAGFNWRDNVALLGGVAAKELVISGLAVTYELDDVEASENIESPKSNATEEKEEHRLARRLRSEPDWSPAKALAMMIFVMLYAPCTGTLAVIWRESGSWRWAALSLFGSTLLAFILAVGIYQLACICGFG